MTNVYTAKWGLIPEVDIIANNSGYTKGDTLRISTLANNGPDLGKTWPNTPEAIATIPEWAEANGYDIISEGRDTYGSYRATLSHRATAEASAEAKAAEAAEAAEVAATPAPTGEWKTMLYAAYKRDYDGAPHRNYRPRKNTIEVWVGAGRPAINGLCPRCGTYCAGDCTASSR